MSNYVHRLEARFLEEVQRNTDMKTELDEARDLISRLRREVNSATNKIHKLEQMLDPIAFLSSR